MAVIYCKFAVYFLLDGFYKQITPMDCKPYLVRYAEAEVEKHINFIRKFDKDDLAYYRK